MHVEVLQHTQYIIMTQDVYKRQRMHVPDSLCKVHQLPMGYHSHHILDVYKRQVLGMLKYFNMHNNKEDKVKLIFLPCYLTGEIGRAHV